MRYLPILIVLVLFSCSNSNDSDNAHPGYDKDRYERAVQLAHSSIILDGHIDVPYRLNKEMEDLSTATQSGEFDYPRARKGGLDAPFMSIFIPAKYQLRPGKSGKVADFLIAMMDSIIAQNPTKFASANTPADVRQNFADGLISLPYGMENGSPLEDDISKAQYYFDKGVRYITLTHGKMNHISDSSYDPNKGWNGLSPFGKELVPELNRLGIMIDISHVSDSTFYQVLRLSKVPVICSHSSLRHFTPGWERNVDDDMLKALARNGGVVQINFGSEFLRQDSNTEGKAYRTHMRQFRAERNIADRDDPAAEAEKKRYRSEKPFIYAHVRDVVAHIDHAVQVAGIDHVGLGSDFDGVGDSLPVGLKSVADFPNLIYHLLEEGYSEQDIKKILGENVLRVWQKAVDFASSTATHN